LLPRAGEVATGVLTHGGVDYLVAVGDGVYETLIYDIAGQKWASGDPRPFRGSHHASEVIGNKLYLFGGFHIDGTVVQIGELAPTPRGGVGVVWSLGASMPFGSGSANTAYIRGVVRSRPAPPPPSPHRQLQPVILPPVHSTS
jgi:hypothetical protein